MWGYGARHDALSEGILDRLYADAIVIDAAGAKLAIVGLDLGRAPSEPILETIRESILETAGIVYSLIAGSHTHHGPVMELSDEPGKGRGRFDAALRYYDRVAALISEAIIEADRRLQPVTVATGSIQLEGFNRNRHAKTEPKPVDTELSVIRFDTEDGEPLAAIVNFAAHPTSIPAGELKYSADYVGALKERVASELNCGVVFMQGAAGDLSAQRARDADYRDYGQALGDHAVSLIRSIRPVPVVDPSLQWREERFTFEARIDLSNPFIRAVYGLAFFPELIPNYADEYKHGVRPRLSVALLNGDIALVGVSGEFFCQHALDLKGDPPAPGLFFFGYCNGYHQYFPTTKAVAQGGYGADAEVAPAAEGAGEFIVERARSWIGEMRAAP